MIDYDDLYVGQEVWWCRLVLTSTGSYSTKTAMPKKYIITAKDKSRVMFKGDGRLERIWASGYGRKLDVTLYDTYLDLSEDWNSFIYSEIDKLGKKLDQKVGKTKERLKRYDREE